MQRTTVEPKTVVCEIVCDRCGKEAQRDDSAFGLTTPIGFLAGYASIFADGNRVEIDLCEPCLRDTLGTWLRITTPDTSLAHRLEKFKPEIHGGEFPTRADTTFVRPDDLPVQERMPLDAEMPAAVLQSFERSADRAGHCESLPSETPHRKRIVGTLSVGPSSFRVERNDHNRWS